MTRPGRPATILIPTSTSTANRIRGGPGLGRAGNRTTKGKWASVFQHPERECRGTSLGWQMTTVGMRARPRSTQSRLYFGSSEADRATSILISRYELIPCSKGFYLACAARERCYRFLL